VGAADTGLEHRLQTAAVGVVEDVAARSAAHQRQVRTGVADLALPLLAREGRVAAVARRFHALNEPITVAANAQENAALSELQVAGVEVGRVQRLDLRRGGHERLHPGCALQPQKILGTQGELKLQFLAALVRVFV